MRELPKPGILKTRRQGVAASTCGAALASDPTVSDDTVLALLPTLPHSAGGLVLLLLIQVLNVCKPKGVTPYGVAQQQEERRRHGLRSEVLR